MMVVGVVLPIFFAAALLFVVDITQGFVHKRGLQSTADAAALAAAYDLVRGNNGSIQADVTYYAQKGQYTGADPMPACATATDTNCYKTPYVNAAGQTRSDQIEIRLNRDCSHSPTFFGGLVNFVTHTNKFGCVPVSARAVGGIIGGPPPPYSFVALNPSCDNHTLVIRLGGILTVTNQIFVNSCSAGDGFDVFGAGGEIRDPVDILTHGGWETHDLDLVKVGLQPDGVTYYQCPYDTAMPGVLPNTAIPPWVAGCPHVGLPIVNDPFAILPPPSLADYNIILNATCTPATPCYNTDAFTPPYFLDNTIAANAPSLIADPTTTPEATPSAPFNIVLEGERMKVTNFGGPPGTADDVAGAHVLAITRGILGTSGAAHTDKLLSNTVSARRVGDEVPVSTCPTAHNLDVHDWVRVTNLDSGIGGLNKVNGIFEVTEIPDGEDVRRAVPVRVRDPRSLLDRPHPGLRCGVHHRGRASQRHSHRRHGRGLEIHGGHVVRGHLHHGRESDLHELRRGTGGPRQSRREGIRQQVVQLSTNRSAGRRRRGLAGA